MKRTWVVGIDVRGRSRGALQFTSWLARASAVPWGEAFVPVHVLDHEHLRMILRYHHLDEVVESERAAVARQIADVLPGEIRPPEMIADASTVAQGLEAARARYSAAGVIVARAAPAAGRRVFRLGRTARQLLRELPCPVVIVPPDLTASAVGEGPIVALSSLTSECVEACRLARAIAEDTRRELSVVHVVRGGPSGRRGAAPSDVPRALEPDHALARWASHHEVWPDRTAVLEGDVAPAALAFAEARHAPLVAVGAHRSTGARAVLEPKLWRRIAANAREPILVAPSERAAAATREAPVGVERVEYPSPDAPP